jgi:DNA-binding NtrC family response regulator
MKTRGLNIFIVEDNIQTSKLLETAIIENFRGASVRTFDSFERAIEQGNKDPDYIILDHFLDGGRNIENNAELKNYLPFARSVFISSKNDIGALKKDYVSSSRTFPKNDVTLTLNVVNFIKQDVKGNTKRGPESISFPYFKKLSQFFCNSQIL